MAFIRRIFSFINNNNANKENEITGDVTIATYYLGKTFAAKPNSDELRRAAHILMSRAKKDLEKNLIPIVYLCFESTTVFLRDARNHNCCEYDVRKIMMSCIDARNQKLVAIFYHNESPYIGPSKNKMIECHLCLCKNKESARSAANQIGEMLSREYKLPSRQPAKKMDDNSVRLSKANYDDFDYENVSKFFQQKVFGLKGGGVGENGSGVSTPCGSVSTFATTNGCDSGCASTIASLDIRCGGSVDDSICSVNTGSISGGGAREPTIDEEHREFNSSFEDCSSSILDDVNFDLQRAYVQQSNSYQDFIEEDIQSVKDLRKEKDNINIDVDGTRTKDIDSNGVCTENEDDNLNDKPTILNMNIVNDSEFSIQNAEQSNNQQTKTRSNSFDKEPRTEHYKPSQAKNHAASETNRNNSSSTIRRGSLKHENKLRETSIYCNRYSVHYDLEDECKEGDDDGVEIDKAKDCGIMLMSADSLDLNSYDEMDNDCSIGLRTPELERLFDLGETSI